MAERAPMAAVVSSPLLPKAASQPSDLLEEPPNLLLNAGVVERTRGDSDGSHSSHERRTAYFMFFLQVGGE